MKVVINRCYGGFELSREACDFIGLEYDEDGCPEDIERTDPRLIECVEKLGNHANGPCADLKVVEIPDDVEWTIEEDDGSEIIEEVHRFWC